MFKTDLFVSTVRLDLHKKLHNTDFDSVFSFALYSLTCMHMTFNKVFAKMIKYTLKIVTFTTCTKNTARLNCT